jgi:hypothetical protein
MSKKQQYRIRTWDIDAQDWTPQEGVPEIANGAEELRHALRLLQGMGYAANRNSEDSDASVLVERV